MIDKIKLMLEKYRMLILYIFFGGLTTLVNMAVFFVLRFFGAGTCFSNVSAWFLSVVFAFITNKYFVFDTNKDAASGFFFQLISFFAARLLSGAIDTAVVVIFIDRLGCNELAVKLLSNIFVIVFNYAASRLVIFRKR
ncbi:MAG: GtrA family protein [Clostridia bacterium]|nr:GtrA family protein [Clostridia bacterium]